MITLKSNCISATRARLRADRQSASLTLTRFIDSEKNEPNEQMQMTVHARDAGTVQIVQYRESTDLFKCIDAFYSLHSAMRSIVTLSSVQ